MPVKVLYALVPSWVTSERDGKRRYVSAGELVKLYKLPPGTYRAVGDRPSVPEAIKAAEKQGLVVLYPDPSGRYELSGREGTEENGESGEDGNGPPAPKTRTRAKGKASG